MLISIFEHDNRPRSSVAIFEWMLANWEYINFARFYHFGRLKGRLADLRLYIDLSTDDIKVCIDDRIACEEAFGPDLDIEFNDETIAMMFKLKFS